MSVTVASPAPNVLRRVVHIQVLTIVWMSVEAIVALACWVWRRQRHRNAFSYRCSLAIPLDVADVDGFWEFLRGKGLQPESPRDGSWGERYFHMPDPDGHELSFARPI